MLSIFEQVRVVRGKKLSYNAGPTAASVTPESSESRKFILSCPDLGRHSQSCTELAQELAQWYSMEPD